MSDSQDQADCAAATATPAPATESQGPAADTRRPPEAPGELPDVWSRTSQKHRVRAAGLLGANLALFCGLCIFTHWLHIGQPFQFQLKSYLDPLRFWGPQTQSLYDFVLYPINVVQTPIHGVVIGLLVASIVAVPISVAMLYRFRSSLPFCAAVLVFAHMPWMAVTLAGSCVLAAVRPFRMNFRFGSALLALVPMALYLYLATRGATEARVASVSPEQMLLQTGPWLLAMLAACAMLATILLIARVVNYRPGAVAPVMAVMFATPAVLFLSYVGVDQLAYRVLEQDYGPRSVAFEPVQDVTDRILEFFRRRLEHGPDRATQDAVLAALSSEQPAEQIASVRQRIHTRLLLDLLAERQQAYEVCKDFIADHPNSRFVPNVLYIQGRALDTRLDALRFRSSQAQRELYADFPHVQSEPVWTSLLSQYPQSPLASAAGLRVAQLRLRRGDPDAAMRALAPWASRAAGNTAPSQPAARPWLYSAPPEGSLDFDPDFYLFEAQRLYELIAANHPDPRFGVRPLQELASLDPHRPGYRDQLRRLAHEYADSRLHANLVVLWANAAEDRAERMTGLRACVDRFPDEDARREALFQLADLEVQSQGGGAEELRATGLARLRELVQKYPGSCWAARAQDRLRMFAPAAPATRGAGSP